MCMCESKERGEERTQDRLDEKGILKKKEMYIDKLKIKYCNVTMRHKQLAYYGVGGGCFIYSHPLSSFTTFTLSLEPCGM